MKKLLKRTGYACLLAFAALLLYANLRQPSPSELLPPIHLKIYALDGVPNAQQAATIEASLSSLLPVTAFALDPANRTASVTFHPTGNAELDVRTALSLWGQFEVEEKYFPPVPSCPVPSAQAVWVRCIKTLSIF